jgi:hypothetical protein
MSRNNSKDLPFFEKIFLLRRGRIKSMIRRRILRLFENSGIVWLKLGRNRAVRISGTEHSCAMFRKKES